MTKFLGTDGSFRPHHLFDAREVRRFDVETIAAQRRIDVESLTRYSAEDIMARTIDAVYAAVWREAHKKRFALAGPTRVEVIVRAEARAVSEDAGLEPRHLDYIADSGARFVIVHV